MDLKRPHLDVKRHLNKIGPDKVSYGPEEVSFGRKKASYGPEEVSANNHI